MLVGQTEGALAENGLAERDNGKVLDYCVDDLGFACGVGIFGEKRH
jgi:hypothetical protein